MARISNGDHLRKWKGVLQSYILLMCLSHNYIRPQAPENEVSRPLCQSKLETGEVVLGWVTTWEFSLLYVFHFLTLLFIILNHGISRYI